MKLRPTSIFDFSPQSDQLSVFNGFSVKWISSDKSTFFILTYSNLLHLLNHLNEGSDVNIR